MQRSGIPQAHRYPTDQFRRRPWRWRSLSIAVGVGLLACATRAAEPPLPPLPPMPAVSPPAPVGSVPMADSGSAPEVKLDLPVSPGPYEPTWASIEQHYPGAPDWLRQAKFGIWVHFGPQASGRSGDWYARRLYQPGTTASNQFHRAEGPLSKVGYKEVLRDWNPVKLDPAALARTYRDAGARFLIIQGVHHDNFDLWDSRYQPWNSVRLGPHRDLLGEWSKAARAAGLHFGVTFHHEYTWWWWQAAFGSDPAGVPFDGRLTLTDPGAAGTWWGKMGLDPRRLYGVDLREYKGVAEAAATDWSPPPDGLFDHHVAYATWYATQWALRMMDVVHKYDPDFIYTDGTSTQPFSGHGTGTGFKADAMQRVVADFYNHTLARRRKVDTFAIIKFRPPTNGTVNTEEFGLPRDIKTDQPWIAEAPIGDWYYAPGFTYSPTTVIRYVVEAVARDGNAAVCVSPLPDGSLDDGSRRMLAAVGRWMRANGDGIYGSHAWSVLGEGDPDGGGGLRMIPGGKLGAAQADFPFSTRDFRFTAGADGAVYAYCMAVPAPGAVLRIRSLGAAGNRLGRPVAQVRMLGHAGPVVWKQSADALEITCPTDMTGLATAVGFRVH